MTNGEVKQIIGVTGGIGTGKSTVSNYLHKVYNLPILDADFYAREAVSKESRILEAIKQRYGKQILQEDGSLNRSKLGKIIFNQPAEKQWLEQKIHPYVRQCITSELNHLSTKQVVVVIPLLFEAEMTDLVTEIWVVYCSPQQQLARVMARDQLSETEARSRIKAQISLEEKMALADVVIDNSGSTSELQQQIDRLLS
ncbi:dephospho-CoA kinase [Dactylococcopsis salina]|uniref:Dephospho-CoA kinase n=1 Tax=Dactylococcopsis salina (strain PCC 8305) TaxID=13035 RepID=K9YZ75_DACS8|nr:dephospho-CoA kinase [Dactylococcopsis salina]AFZ51630.1 dephospho-CoA kinase [Dactylococcopsis salina PCC 8305]